MSSKRRYGRYRRHEPYRPYRRYAAYPLYGVTLAVFTFLVAPLLADSLLVIKAPSLHVGDGPVLKPGVLIIEGGRIQKVGSEVAEPESDQVAVIEVEGGSITPGLVDANARIEPQNLLPSTRQTTAGWLRSVFDPARSPATGDSHDHDGDPHDHLGEPAFASGVRTEATTEQSSEVVPHTRVLDSLDLTSPDFERLVRGGVTTVYASPDSSAVIGARGAILKTAGPASGRIIQEEAAVKAVFGSDPTNVGTSNRSARGRAITLYTRRPTTRMGVTWVFRKAFYDTIAQRQGLPVGGADTPSEEASAVLTRVLDGSIPLRVQARTLTDITTAYRLCREFEVPFTIEEATEAYRCLDLLKSHPVPVIFGPIESRPTGLRRSTYETREARLYTLRALLDAEIPAALSAQDLREENGLARQAMYAMRFGVGADDALRAVTSTPAGLLGIDARVGTLEPGKDADLVVWNGPPFAATSMPVVVLVGGEVVVDRREELGS